MQFSFLTDSVAQLIEYNPNDVKLIQVRIIMFSLGKTELNIL